MRLAAVSAAELWPPSGPCRRQLSPPPDQFPQPCRRRRSSPRFSRPPVFPRPRAPVQPQPLLPVRLVLLFRQRPLPLRRLGPALPPWLVPFAWHPRPLAVHFPQPPCAL